MALLNYTLIALKNCITDNQFGILRPRKLTWLFTYLILTASEITMG